MIALKAVGLTKVYRHSTRPALDDLDLEIEGGQIFTILGRNGAGKTTFLRIASPQLMPTSGSVTVVGLDAVRQAKELRERIAITPQEAETIYPLTARDHVMLSLRMRGVDKLTAVKKTRAAIEALELGEVADMNTDWLSGGLKQRVIVAMAIATDAEMIFLDEPSIGLDPLNRRRVWGQLTLGLFVGTDLASYKIQNKFQDIVVASPVSPLIYMFGIALSELIFGAPALLVLFGLMAWHGATTAAIATTMGVVILLWITTTTIGFFFSAYAPSTQNAFIINGFIATLLSVLPPVYYSISILPAFLRPLAEVLPTTEASALFQGAIGLGYSIDPIFSFGVLLAASVILLLLVSFKMKWRET